MKTLTSSFEVNGQQKKMN